MNTGPQHMDFGGAIHIRLDVKGGRVAAVDVRSTRPPEAAQVFRGRRPADVARMMGLIFSLCGRAQTVCALEALEQAQGLSHTPETARARDAMRLAEMLSQTTLRVCLDWPRLLDVPPRPEIARACLDTERGLEQALFAGADWRMPGGIAFSPDLDGARAELQELTVLLDEVVQGDLADKLRAALAKARLEGFGAAESVREEDEIGALKRQWRAAAVAGARAAHGSGLLARLEARLADVFVLLGDLDVALSETHMSDAPVQSAAADGTGRACVETARGPLTHSVTLKDGVVQQYVIDAPTDVNFAPDGVVARGLLDAAGGDEAHLKAAAELFALAVDPCVACHLEVDHA